MTIKNPKQRRNARDFLSYIVFFRTVFGQKPLKAFKIKAFSGSLVGFESRTGHQQKKHRNCPVLFCCIFSSDKPIGSKAYLENLIATGVRYKLVCRIKCLYRVVSNSLAGCKKATTPLLSTTGVSPTQVTL